MNARALRAMTVLLLASLLLGDGRVLAAPEAPASQVRQTAPSTIRFLNRLAVALKRAEKRITLAVRHVRRAIPRIVVRVADPLVRTPLLAHQCRLPPPTIG